MSSATGSPRSFSSLSASRASAPESARTTRYLSPYWRRMSRATARETAGASSTVRIAGSAMGPIQPPRSGLDQQLALAHDRHRQRLVAHLVEEHDHPVTLVGHDGARPPLAVAHGAA